MVRHAPRAVDRGACRSRGDRHRLRRSLVLWLTLDDGASGTLRGPGPARRRDERSARRRGRLITRCLGAAEADWRAGAPPRPGSRRRCSQRYVRGLSSPGDPGRRSGDRHVRIRACRRRCATATGGAPGAAHSRGSNASATRGGARGGTPASGRAATLSGGTVAGHSRAARSESPSIDNRIGDERIPCLRVGGPARDHLE